MKINNVTLALLICAGMIVAWHLMPIPTPEIIPVEEQPDAPLDTPGTADVVVPGACR